MTGMAALAICAAFTSCSKDTDVYNSGVVNENNAVTIVEQYNQKFLKYVGANSVADIPSNQTWGFGGYEKANTRDAYPNGNMWADEGWKVPPVISDAQKDIVRRYFQQNTPIGYDDPEWTNFWIQQVYKGGTKTTDGSLTTEKYTIGNGDEVTGGDHMDHLCSKDANGKEDHVNNFNNSDNNSWEGRMLMLNSSTYSFGYINSNATAIHYDKAALVKWDVIAQWAVDNELEESVEKSVLNDGWNRSYMGFDWEQALPDDCYSVNIQTTGGWTSPENYKEGVEYYNGFEVVSKTYNTFEFEGNTYKFLSANSNQYAYDEDEPTFGGKKNYNDRPSDATIRQLLSLGYLPYSDTLKDWIKLSTGADGYYSDWIVTLTEAEKNNQDSDPNDVCIIAEDLTIGDDTDFDFNDVVFTVHYTSDTEADITLYAAGGTLPLTVAGTEVHAKFGYADADPVTGMYKMINTGAKADVNDVATQTFHVTGINKSERGKDIEIKVNKGTAENPNWIPLTATGGAPAAKLCVGTDFATEGKWCAERESIKNRYPRFSEWVLNNPTRVWWK